MTGKRYRPTNAERQEIREAIYEIAEQERPITVRGLFYRVMSRGLVPKTENSYGIVQRETLRMRRTGDLSYGWITDGSRRRFQLQAYTGLDHALNETARFYRRRLWDDQNAYVEVWTEKDAITGVIKPVTFDYDVPLVVARGYASETFLWEAAQAIMDADKPTYIYQLGDHDRDGVQAFDSIGTKLREFVDGDIPMTFERIAVTPAQIDELDLPTRPDKTQSGFGECVEVDAIESNTLRRLTADAISRHIDQDALAKTQAEEASERDVLKAIAGQHGNTPDHDGERERRRAQREAKYQRELRRRAAIKKRDQAHRNLRDAEAKLDAIS